ncbi:Translation initiation factor IF-3 [Anthophora retusa]
MTRFILNRSNSLLLRNDEIIQYVKYNFLQYQIRLCSSYIDDIAVEKKEPKKKTARIPEITLIYPDKSTTVTILDAAQKLAKRRNFNLVKVLDNDPKSNRSVYELISPSSYKIEHDFEEKKADEDLIKCKCIKLYTVKPKISEHDLEIKIKNMNKVLSKMHKVKIIINFQGLDVTNIMKQIQEKVEGYKQYQIIKKETIIFMFSPLASNENNSSDNDTADIEPSNETK